MAKRPSIFGGKGPPSLFARQPYTDQATWDLSGGAQPWAPLANAGDYSAYVTPPFGYQNTVDPGQQTGFAQLGHQAWDAVANTPKAIYNLPSTVNRIPEAAAKGGLWGINALADMAQPFWDKTVAPTVQNASDWLSQTGPEYQAGKERKKATLKVKAQPVYQAPFSPTGELANIAQLESGNDPNAQNSRSSAGGAYQIIDQTWLGLLKQQGPKYGLQDYSTLIQGTPGNYTIKDPAVLQRALALKSDPKISGEMAQEHATYVQQMLAKGLGRLPTREELHLGWVFDRNAVNLLKADQNSPATMFASKAAISANPNLFYDQSGKPRTVGQLRAAANQSGGASAPSGQRPQVMASGSFSVPQAPQMQPIPGQDFSAQDALLKTLAPAPVDQEYLASQKRNLVLAGLAQGLGSTEGGISGMLARMASGYLGAQGQAGELTHQEQVQHDKEVQKYNATAFDYQGSKSQAKYANARDNAEIGFKNSSSNYDRGLQIAKLSQLQMEPDGMLRTSVFDPKTNQMHEQITDVGSIVTQNKMLLAAQMGLGGHGLGGMGGSSGSGIPESVKKYAQLYGMANLYSQSGQPGGDAAFFGTLSDEILNSPYSTDLLGGGDSQSKFYRDVQTTAAKTGRKPEDVAIGMLTHQLQAAAQSNPKEFQKLMSQAAGYGLVGPRLMGGQ